MTSMIFDLKGSGELMPLQMASELRFSMGATCPLSEQAVSAVLSLLRRSSGAVGQQFIIETFKKHFCKVDGLTYSKSSSLDWAESDLNYYASTASKNAPGFIAAACDALEELEHLGVSVPQPVNINAVLSSNNVPYVIRNNTLVELSQRVSPPEIKESISEVVARALSDAQALVGTADASSAIDRAHTALHGYVLELCCMHSISLPDDATLSKAFKQLREGHPAFAPTGPRPSDVFRVLSSFAGAVDSFSTLRNNASLAHVNELLLVPEATASLNAMYTIFRYIQDCIRRYEGRL